METCSKCKQTIHKPTDRWYIENDHFVYSHYDSEDECRTIFEAMKAKNPDLRMKKTNSDCVLYPYYSGGFNF